MADLDLAKVVHLRALLARHRHPRWTAGQDRGDGTAQVYSPSDGPMRVVVPICETTAEDAALIAESRNALSDLLDAAELLARVRVYAYPRSGVTAEEALEAAERDMKASRP